MGENTNISWADYTFNGWVGCTRISPACDGCYAAHMMETRFSRVTWGGPGAGNGTRERTSVANWRKPISWNKKAIAEGNRPLVFCSSLADVFDNAVPEEWRKDLFDLIRATPNLVWLLLTKRPMNIAKLSAKAGGLPPNAAIGTTVEDQPRAIINVPALLDASQDLWHANTKPFFTFLSCEPLLGDLDLTDFQGEEESQYHVDALRGKVWIKAGTNTVPSTSYIVGDRDYVGLTHKIDWVIGGGETDQGEHMARPTHPQWARNLRDQCAAANVPFHWKQNGEWVSVSEVAGPGDHYSFPDGSTVRKIKKARSGRTIDGVTHDAFPYKLEIAA